MGVAYKNLSVKSDFSQMHPSRSGFDFERGAFHVYFNLNEFKQIRFTGLMGGLILNVRSVFIACLYLLTFVVCDETA